MADIVSIDTISREASAAAEGWKPGQEQPENPYDAAMQPEHFAEWERRFTLAIARLSNPAEAEGAA